MGVRGKRYQATDVFVVLVITRSMRNQTAGRLGGVTSREVGVNQLLGAVKTLLINQTLDGLVHPIQPKRIRTIWNNAEVKKRNSLLMLLSLKSATTSAMCLMMVDSPKGLSRMSKSLSSIKAS